MNYETEGEEDRERRQKQAHKETLPGCFPFPSRGESAQHKGLKKDGGKHCPNTPVNKDNCNMSYFHTLLI